MKRIVLGCLIGLVFLLRNQVFILAEDSYQPFSSVEQVVDKLSNYQRSELVDYKQVIDQQFSLDSLMDLFNPYYYYSINTNSSGSSETTRTKVVSAYCDPYYYEVAMAKSDGTFEHIACVETFDEAKELKSQASNLTFEEVPVVLNNGAIVMSFKPAIVQFKTTSCGANHNLKSRQGSRAAQDTYINACYIDDAFLLNEEQDDLQIFMSGYDGWLSRHPLYDAASNTETWVNIIPTNQVQNPSFYKREGEDLVHYISNDVRDSNATNPVIIGRAPEWMQEETNYYSYDGNYFYGNWADINIDGTNAINELQPFYNYFQYLTYRSKTNYSLDELNAFLETLGYIQKPTVYPASDNESQLVGEGESFIQAQEQFGINGGLEFAMAMHESGLGRSKISIEKNNTFGMNATDNNPYGNATQFSSVRNGIFYHAQRYMSWGYTDAIDDFRYFGPHVGNKASGMNVKYASDPYWGEKIAGHYYRMDKTLGAKDYNYYQLAIKQGNERLTVNLDPTLQEALYTIENGKSDLPILNYPLLVLEQSDNAVKVQSDMAIDLKSREALMNTNYDFSSSSGYIKSDSLYYVNGATPKTPADIKTYLELNKGTVIPLSSMLDSLGIAGEQLEIQVDNDAIIQLRDGNIEALDQGLVTVSIYEQDKLFALFDIRVVIPLKKIKIESSTKKLSVGQSLQLTAQLTPIEASNQQVMWISSDSKIATVDQDGIVQALTVGEVTISLLSDEGGIKDEITLKIKGK